LPFYDFACKEDGIWVSLILKIVLQINWVFHFFFLT
jgi:hypothetical protein